MMERRLWREASFDLTGKILRINWLYVLLLCGLAAVGYTALYSAAGGSAEPYAGRHLVRFCIGLTLMLCVALIDIRTIQRLSWVAYAVGVGLLIAVMRMGQDHSALPFLFIAIVMAGLCLGSLFHVLRNDKRERKQLP